MESYGKARLTLRPGDPGTRRLTEKFGDRLIAVRYRYNERKRRRYTTVELIVDEGPWVPERHIDDPNRLVGLRIGFAEEELRQRLKEAKARWDPEARLWWLPLHRVVQLRLEPRIAAWSPPAATDIQK